MSLSTRTSRKYWADRARATLRSSDSCSCTGCRRFADIRQFVELQVFSLRPPGRCIPVSLPLEQERKVYLPSELPERTTLVACVRPTR